MIGRIKLAKCELAHDLGEGRFSQPPQHRRLSLGPRLVHGAGTLDPAGYSPQYAVVHLDATLGRLDHVEQVDL